MTTAIVTDTACNITPELAEELNIYLLPLEILFGETTYKEGFELSTKEFYEKMEESEKLPTTSQPNIADAYQLYEQLSEEYDEILSIHMSSELSGTVQALSAIAEEFDEAKITIYDTKLVTVPASELVIYAKHLADEGKAAAEIIPALEKYSKEIMTFFTLSSLKNLVEGGRISSVAGAIVKLIKIKPVISITSEEIKMRDTVRSYKRALKKLKKHALEHIDTLDYPFKIILGHGNIPEIAEDLRQDFLEQFSDQEIEIQRITGVIGVHTGSEAVGIVVAPDYSKM